MPLLYAVLLGRWKFCRVRWRRIKVDHGFRWCRRERRPNYHRLIGRQVWSERSWPHRFVYMAFEHLAKDVWAPHEAKVHIAAKPPRIHAEEVVDWWLPLRNDVEVP